MKLSTYKRGLIIRFRNRFKKKEHKTGEHIKILSHYKNERTPMKFKCLDCGLVFTKKPINIFNGGFICPKLGKEHHVKATRKANLYRYFINIHTIRKWVKKLVGNKYKVLSKKYTDNSTKMLWEHCDKNCIYYQKYHKFYKFHMCWASFKNGSRCPIDGLHKEHNEIRKPTDVFKYEVAHKTHNQYKVLGIYKNSQTPILLEHCSKQCKFYQKHHKYYKFRMRPDSILSETKHKHFICPYDARACRDLHSLRSSKSVHELIRKYGHGHYIVLGKYRGMSRHMIFVHKYKKCTFYKNTGHYYKYLETPGNFIYSHRRCPYNLITHGEEFVNDWLLNHGLEPNKDYIYHYIWHCHPYSHFPPHFDFYLPHIRYNKYYPQIAIEFDGAQHFKIVDWSGKESLQYQHKHLHHGLYMDNHKDKYCKHHRIKMIRIKNKKDYRSKKLHRFVNRQLNKKLGFLFK